MEALAAQQAAFDAATLRRTVCIEQANTLRAEAARLENESATALATEAAKLEKCKQNILASEVAATFGTGRLQIANPKLKCGSYTVAGPDGKQIRFAVKQVAYLLKLKGDKIVGLAEPRKQNVKTASFRSYRRKGIIYKYGQSTISETDLYNLLRETDLRFPLGIVNVVPYVHKVCGYYVDITNVRCTNRTTNDWVWPAAGMHTTTDEAMAGHQIILHVAVRTDMGRAAAAAAKK